VVNTTPTGDSYIEHWNGTAWRVTRTLPAIEYPHLTGITARSATDVWAVGSFLAGANTSTPVRQTRTYHWNGTAWSLVASPNAGTGGTELSGAASVGSRVWAVGTAAGPFVITRTT
jgi:hypothetical protein